tara:strand:+ start:572 stop:862 length:291 start_codon:yes stop_codon:yes gene_type:complete
MIALQSNILFGDFSRSVITEEPVVVIPDILSKNESLNEKSRSERIKGIEPNKATAIHEKAENKKVCLRFRWYSSCKLIKTNITPIKIVIKADDKKL